MSFHCVTTHHVALYYRFFLHVLHFLLCLLFHDYVPRVLSRVLATSRRVMMESKRGAEGLAAGSNAFNGQCRLRAERSCRFKG